MELVRFLPDPLSVGSEHHDGRWFTAAFATALLAHALSAVALPNRTPGPPTDAAEKVTRVIDIAPPDLPARTEPPPPLPAPTPDPRTPTHRSNATVKPAPPAEAAAIVTRENDSDAPLDLTNRFVVGSATSYAGGTTAATGTRRHGGIAQTASAGPISRSPPGETGAADLSEAPRLSGGASWSCPFPPAADAHHVHHAVATIRVKVHETGKVGAVSVVRDPGHGFGEAARLCARSRLWAPGRDRQGRPVAATVTLNVRFTR